MLQDLFISKVRVNILKLLLLNPGKSFHVRGIVRAVEVEINAIRRELARLEGISLVVKRQSGNRIYYTANTSHLYYPELVSLLAKEGDYATVRLPSGEMRRVAIGCKATLGQLGNLDHLNVNLGKAGRKRHLGIRPTVRGSAMNPVDHGHGGGEGRSPIGGQPKTPWGKPAMGKKTRKPKLSDKYIVARRKK